MTDKPQAGVLASLPHTRPHRRSAKRSPAELAGQSAQAPAEPTLTEAKSVSAKPKRPARPAAKARTAKATAAKPAGRPRSTKAQPAKATTAKPGAKAPVARARSAKPATASQTPRVPSSQSGRSHHTPPRTQAPRRAGGEPSAPDATAGPLATAVQAAAELAEIGMMASARALRGALSRLPRP